MQEGAKVLEAEPRPEQPDDDGPFCRLCFNKSDELSPLFPPASIPNKTLLHKIFDCTTVTLSFRDDHNAQICTGCVVNIESFFKYKIKCVENDKTLRKRRTSFFSGLGLTSDSKSAADKSATGNDSSKPSTDDKDDESSNYEVKEELINEDDDDDDDYFNPDQFLSQETQIGDKQLDQAAINGNGAFERGWKTTEFSSQPGNVGLKPLKITDYSNMTGHPGRPQKFITTVPTERLMAPRPSQYPNPFHTSSPLPQTPTRTRGFEGAFREHLHSSNGGRVSSSSSGMPQHSTPLSAMGNRFEPYAMSSAAAAAEQTRKVQKFLDDGLRDLILQAGKPNVNFAMDGSYTNFKVVKARCNSYNLIFESNRFLRRNKSCSGLPKWYWACSNNGCLVKICSYRGRLYKTNDKINHNHPPTELDDSKLEIVLPHHIDEIMQQQHPTPPSTPSDAIQAQALQLQQRQHQQYLMRQQQFHRLQQVQQQQRHQQMKIVPPMKQPKIEKEYSEAEAGSYEIVKDEEGGECLMYKEHKHKPSGTEAEGVKVWKCTQTNEDDEVCTDTVRQFVDGKIKIERIVVKEASDDEDDNTNSNDGELKEMEPGRVRSRAPRIAVWEGFHYKYCHARPEGTFYWRCILKQDNNCLASLHTKASFEFINLNDQAHNHDPPDPAVQLENAIMCMITPAQKPANAPPSGSTDFQLVKSGQKREFLLYQGYRYYFQYESKSGKRSYRCTSFRNCPAGAFLMPDNTIQEAKNFVHTHPPTDDLDKYVTKDSLITSPIKDHDGNPGRQQTSVADSGRFPMIKESAPQNAVRSEEVARANGYKIILNYKNKEILIYNGWRYFVDYKKKNGGQVWRCSSHRLCRGAVHLFPDGSINYAKLIDHNHQPPRRNVYSTPLPLDSSIGTDGDGENSFTYPGAMLHPPPELSANAYAPPAHRFILHQGHRFRFATRKREGTIYWRCAMRLETKCPVSFHTKEDTYELVSMRNHEHNHDIPNVWPEIAGGNIEEALPTVKMPQEEIGTSDYILTKNSKGRDVVLYQNGRYYLDYSRKDGKVVFRCSTVAGCRATVFLLPNKTLIVPRDLIHTHGMVPLLKSSSVAAANQLAMLERSANASIDDTTDGAKSEDEVQIVADPDPLDIDADDSMDQTSSPSQLPSFIVYHGYHYKFVSRNEHDKTALWRCSNFEAKLNCPASLYTTLTGEVIRTNNLMHNHKAEAYNNAAVSNSLARRKELIGTRDYKIVKNWKGRDVLIFQQCRYFLHYVRKDGRKVWRCSAIRSCHAAVYLGADGRVDLVKGEHVHDIREEGEPRRRRARRTRLEIMQARGIPMMPSGNGTGHPQGNGNEWIDYSDYSMSGMGGMGNSSGADNNSLWDNFNPHQMTEAAAGGDFGYHSVFGGQSSFNDSFGMMPEGATDTTAIDDDDDEEELPLEPDVSFQETDNFDSLEDVQHLEPVVELGDD